MTGRLVGRRAFLLGGGALALAACAGEGPRPPTVTTSSAAPATTPTPAPRLPSVTPWAAGPNEVRPEVKTAATRIVESLGNVPDPGGAPQARLIAAGFDPALADRARALVPPSAPAVAQVVYPQYGGLTSDAASVMVVVEQVWADDASEEVVRRTVTADVRLARVGAGWTVVDLRPATVGSVAAAPGPIAQLLANRSVRLPEAARSDLAAGLVAPEVVQVLLGLAAAHQVDVSVLRSGHPEEVFGTTMTSNHTRGRAVDVWAVDGRHVVDMAPDDPVLLRFLASARALGSDEIGGPTDPDGAGGAHFSDALHRDHVHIGFDR